MLTFLEQLLHTRHYSAHFILIVSFPQQPLFPCQTRSTWQSHLASYIVCTVFLERWPNVDRQRKIPEGLAVQKVVVAVSCRHHEVTKDLKEVEWLHLLLRWSLRENVKTSLRGEEATDVWVEMGWSPRRKAGLDPLLSSGVFTLVCLCPSLLSVFITVVMDVNQWAWLPGLKYNLNSNQLFKTGQSKTFIYLHVYSINNEST